MGGGGGKSIFSHFLVGGKSVHAAMVSFWRYFEKGSFLGQNWLNNN